MDTIDVINQIADKKKLPQREGKVISIHPTHLMVAPKGSTRLIPCDFDGGQPVEVGQWCTFLRTGKRHVISSIFNKPRTLSQATTPLSRIAISDSGLHGNIGGEIARIRQKDAPTEDDWIMINDAADGNRPKAVKVGDLPFGRFTTLPEPLCFNGEILFLGGDVLMIGVSV